MLKRFQLVMFRSGFGFLMLWLGMMIGGAFFDPEYRNNAFSITSLIAFALAIVFLVIGVVTEYIREG